MSSFLEVTDQGLISMELFAVLITDYRIDFEPIMNQMSPRGIVWQLFEFPHQKEQKNSLSQITQFKV